MIVEFLAGSRGAATGWVFADPRAGRRRGRGRRLGRRPAIQLGTSTGNEHGHHDSFDRHAQHIREQDHGRSS